MTNETTSRGQICAKQYRLTILTPQLIRLEYAKDGLFEDRPTQTVVCRAFDAPEYRVFRSEKGIEVHTSALTLYYDEKPFSPNGLRIENRSESGGIYCTWHYGDVLRENLGGTARTLDEADGVVPLEDGLLSRLEGYAVIDDSHSFIQLENGWFEPRREGISDLYFFGYGYQYLTALKDFFKLCGATPLLPRYALGNWWSRFHAYSDGEYLRLMDRFSEAHVPLSVAVIDMDWHVTDAGPDGKGWTGYTWNKELFADPPAFLRALHQRGLKVTLNVHPAEGVQAHEEMYAAVAKALGKDAERRQRIPFDVTDRAFMDAYFAFLHHPLETQGVDFWWIDWQQGVTSGQKGLDPLWMLNALHTRDMARDGKRPLILSRYAGIGSHRYPVGFSGDSVISWKSLAFQPYFTATASNAGYGWWSHDIGGHTHGKRDDELQVRWLQFGVFSPILRMHSTNNPFNGKEPWRYPRAVETIMNRFLLLRHQLVPYLYTMVWRCHTQGRLLIEPIYYRYPRRDEAYRVPNQYFFGSQLMVCPITRPTSPVTQMAQTTAFIPDGVYYDMLTGVRYQGGRMLKMSRPLCQLPVLAAAGAILPLASKADAAHNGVGLPQTLDILVCAGADGDFSLYEDDGETKAYQGGALGFTAFALRWGASPKFTIRADEFSARLTPQRSYRVCLMGVEENAGAEVTDEKGRAVGTEVAYDEERHALTVLLKNAAACECYTMRFTTQTRLRENDVLRLCEQILNRAQIEYELKQKIYDILRAQTDAALCISAIMALDVPAELLDALVELLA